MRWPSFAAGVALLAGIMFLLRRVDERSISAAAQPAWRDGSDSESAPKTAAVYARSASGADIAAVREVPPEYRASPAPVPARAATAAAVLLGMPYGKLAELYATQRADAEWTRNSLTMAESFLTEAGLDPDSLTRVECRQTLCKIELEPGLPMDKLLRVTGELEYSGIPVSAQFVLGASGTLDVRGAFVAKEGFEQQIQSMVVKPSPEEQAAAQLPAAEPDDAPE